MTEPYTCDYRMNFELPIPCSLLKSHPHFNSQSEISDSTMAPRDNAVGVTVGHVKNKIVNSLNGLKNKVSNFCKRKPSRYITFFSIKREREKVTQHTHTFLVFFYCISTLSASPLNITFSSWSYLSRRELEEEIESLKLEIETLKSKNSKRK